MCILSHVRFYKCMVCRCFLNCNDVDLSAYLCEDRYENVVNIELKNRKEIEELAPYSFVE